MATAVKSDYFTSFQAIGKGVNAGSDGNLKVDSGWDVESSLSGSVILQVAKPMKSVKIVGEFRGFCETRWETMTRLATKPESPSYKIARTGKIFQQLVEVIYDSKHPLQTTLPSAPLSLPFKFKLPKSGMPATYESNGCTIQYYVKFTVLYQEGMKLLKTNLNFDVPVIVSMPESAKLKLLKAPSQFNQTSEATEENCGYSIDIPKRVIAVGETLEVDLSVTKTPGDAKLRMVYATVRPVVSCKNQDGLAAQVVFPRPLSEMTQMFPLLKVDGNEVVGRKLFLLIDPGLAQASFEAAMVSSKTVFKLQIVLDSSETPNISVEIPIVVVPPPTGAAAREGSLSLGAGQSTSSIHSGGDERNRILRLQESNSFLNVLQSPPLSPAQVMRENTLATIYSRTSANSIQQIVTPSPNAFGQLSQPMFSQQQQHQNQQIPQQQIQQQQQEYYAQQQHMQQQMYNQQQQSQMNGQQQPTIRDQPPNQQPMYSQQQQQQRQQQQQQQQQQPVHGGFPQPVQMPVYNVPAHQSQTQLARHESLMSYASSRVTNNPLYRQDSVVSGHHPPTSVPVVRQKSTSTQRNINSVQDDLNSFLNELGLDEPAAQIQSAVPAYTPMSAMPPIPTAAPMDSKLQRQLEWEWSAPQPVQAEQQPRAPSAAPYPDTAAPLFPTQMAQAHLNYSALSAPPPVQAQSPEWDQQSTARGPSVISDSASAFLSAFRNSAEDWTVQMVGDWLSKIGASVEIVQNFADQEIDGSILATLTLDDLKTELGVSALGLRRKIMMGIEKLKSGQ